MVQKNLIKFQHCSFLNVENASIKTVSLKSVGNNILCAIARSDGSIDIWKYLNNNETWCECAHIVGCESLLYLTMAWIGPKTLLLGGTSSDMCLVNFKGKISKKYINCGGSGCVWCMSVHPKEHLLVVGTDDASVILFDISNENIIFKRVIDKCLGKILCIDWHPTDEVFACATDNSRIYVFDANKNVCLSTMNADRILGVNATIWSILLLKDMTVVIGDSFGKVQFYDGNYGTLINNFHSHQAAILTLTADKNMSTSTTVYASGVDNKIVSFHPTKDNDNKWTQGFEYRCHLNDIVKVACVRENMLLSASVDGSCQLYRLVGGNLTKLCSFGLFPEHQKVTITNNYITYYQGSTIHLYLHDSYPQKLLELKIQGDDHIQDLLLARQGDFLCCSTANDVRCYSIELTNDNTLNIKNVASFANIKPYITHTLFNSSDNSKKAILLNTSKKYLNIQIIDFDTQNYELYKVDNFLISGPYFKIQCCLSPNDKVFGILAPFNYNSITTTATTTTTNNHEHPQICLYSTNNFELLSMLPPLETIVSSFDLTNNQLVFSSLVRQIFNYTYCVDSSEMVLNTIYELKNLSKHSLITQIFIENNSDDVVCVTRYGAYKILDFLKTKHHKYTVKDVKFNDVLLMVKQLENNSYVTIVRSHGDIIQEQSPAFKRKRFGLA